MSEPNIAIGRNADAGLTGADNTAVGNGGQGGRLYVNAGWLMYADPRGGVFKVARSPRRHQWVRTLGRRVQRLGGWLNR